MTQKQEMRGKKECLQGQAWWNMPIIPALRRLRQEHLESHASLGYTVRPSLKKKQKKRKNKEH
jgi:hypothetical protein